jgi:LDH2 family malate/lactate/ureidoglycolate dehydrogenase
MTTRLDPDTLVTFGADVLPAVGLPEPDARLVAESLITADLWGHPSHGMLRLDWYVAGLWSGRDAPGHRDVPDEHEDPDLDRYLADRAVSDVPPPTQAESSDGPLLRAGRRGSRTVGTEPFALLTVAR